MKLKIYKKGIKICRYTKIGELVSAFSVEKRTEYKYNEWTKRPENCGPLAIFDTLDNAKEFMALIIGYLTRPSFKYILCKYKKSKDKKLWMTYKDGGRRVRSFLPIGTICADKIKLLKKVEEIV